jgi:hypothetical protein
MHREAHSDDLPLPDAPVPHVSIPPYARVQLRVNKAEGMVLPYEVYAVPATSVPVTFFRSRITLNVCCRDLIVVAYETDEQRKKREKALEAYETELNRSLRF